MSFPQRRSATVLIIVGALAAGACVKPDAPGVAIRPLKADIVFGVKDAVEPAKPATFEMPGEFASVEEFRAAVAAPEPAELVLPEQPTPFESAPLPKRSVPLLRAAEACPEAKQNAFPLLEATRTVTNQPVPGLYRWKSSGSVTQVINGQTLTIPVNGFQQRIITNVSTVTATPNPLAEDPTNPENFTKTFTFQMLQPGIGPLGTTRRITYQVRTGATAVRNTPGVEVPRPAIPNTPVGAPPTTQPPPDLPDSVSAGDPERGISIKRVEDVGADGNVERDSVYSPAVLVLPLAVLPDELFRSVGVDNRNQTTLVHEGQVKSRNRVDACGEIVDGWEVAVTQTFADGPETLRQEATFFFSTQYGGMPILEQVKFGDEATFTANLGQLNPDPLPTS